MHEAEQLKLFFFLSFVVIKVSLYIRPKGSSCSSSCSSRRSSNSRISFTSTSLSSAVMSFRLSFWSLQYRWAAAAFAFGRLLLMVVVVVVVTGVLMSLLFQIDEAIRLGDGWLMTWLGRIRQKENLVVCQTTSNTKKFGVSHQWSDTDQPECCRCEMLMEWNDSSEQVKFDLTRTSNKKILFSVRSLELNIRFKTRSSSEVKVKIRFSKISFKSRSDWFRLLPTHWASWI